MSNKVDYRGRFAPSPTGPLHFGSLVAATGSYLQARQQNGLWFVRMEDLDPPREVAGAATEILQTLEYYGFYWDSEIIFQSQRTDAYEHALEQLTQLKQVYPCSCSRKEIEAHSTMGRYGPIYPGTCRQGPKTTQSCALRVLTHSHSITFNDTLQGHFAQTLGTEIGDFVVRRADQLFAYQLAVVVDDAEQQISEIVRGADLLDNTPRQIYLQQLLGLDTPNYIHLPLALSLDGQKLSKQTGAKSIRAYRPQEMLFKVLGFLNQNPPTDLVDADIDSFWQWAITHWQLENVPKHKLSAPLL